MQASTTHTRVNTDVSSAAEASGTAHSEICLRCPRCGANLHSLVCEKCWLQLREQAGIIHALPPERIEHYAHFMKDYEHIRAAEGRGSTDDGFYLNLPYHDISGINSKQWRIRARSYDHLRKHVFEPDVRHGGRILDLGAGNCWMSFRLALAGYRPVAVDLLANTYDGLGAAEHYRQHLPDLFPRFQAELQHLPFQDGQFDVAIFNASFHYAESAEAALREALRCTRSSGAVIISDTPWYSSEESGNEMVRERRGYFLQHYGTASATIESIEFLTNERLRALEKSFGIRWNIYSPNYGLRWAMRPMFAQLRLKREPARFRIYVVQKASV